MHFEFFVSFCTAVWLNTNTSRQFFYLLFRIPIAIGTIFVCSLTTSGQKKKKNSGKQKETYAARSIHGVTS